MIQFTDITKTFAGAVALDHVSLSIARGECHALMGENGAGKSTLGKILAGIHRPDSGTIRIDGKPAHFRSPAEAQRSGVGMVHQELAFCPDLSVAENLCMSHYPRRVGIISRCEMRRRSRSLLEQIGVDLDVRLPMRALSTAQEQLVQIASAVGTGANVLIFDEPTSSLSEPESRRLFDLIEALRSRGVTMIYVSHRMPEVLRLCDRLSVLRDGKYIGTLSRTGASEGELVRMMIGREFKQYFPSRATTTNTGVSTSAARGSGPPESFQQAPTSPILFIRDLCSFGKFKGVSFDVRAGEILGFAGLIGSGRSEVAKAIFGLDSSATGTVTLLGKPLPLGKVRTAMRRGIALVPEDRKRQGLVLSMSARANLSMATLDRLSRLGLLDQRTERREAMEQFARLHVKAPGISTPVAALSGGNQQKIVLGKWLARGGKVLIVDEPTRGVDVAAKAAIHKIIDDLASRGMAIILISSELPEVINLATRILVMREGQIVGEVSRENATQEKLLRLMSGISEAA